MRQLSINRKLADPHNLDNSPITIAVLHHPPTWVHNSEENSYKQRPASYVWLANQTHMILCGHTHSEVLEKPTKKNDTSYLFSVGATAINQPYRTNCQLLKIKAMEIERLKLYYEPCHAPPRWRLEYDDEGPYSLGRRDIVKLMAAKIRQNPHLITRLEEESGVCISYIQDLLESFSELIPLQLPGIEMNLPPMSDNSIDNIIISRLKVRAERIDTITQECLNLESDWLSQRVWLLAGNFWYFVRNFEKALKYYDELEFHTPVLKLKSKEPSFVPFRLLFNKGVTLIMLCRYQLALKTFDKVLAIYPIEFVSHYNKGLILVQLNEMEKAIKSFENAIELNPGYFPAWSNKSLALAELGKFDEAIESINQSIALKPDLPELWYNKGSIFTRACLFRKAIESLDQALNIRPNYLEALYNKANALLKINRIEDAIHYFNKILEIDPNDFKSLSNRGNAFLLIKKPKEAVESYDRALNVKPDHFSAWSNKANALTNLKRFKDAQKAVNRAIEINPQYFHAWLNKGHIYAEISNFYDAIDSYKKAYQIKPSDPTINYLLASMYSLVKMNEKSIKYLRQAIRLDHNLKYKVIKDVRFNNLRKHPKFKKLVHDST